MRLHDAGVGVDVEQRVQLAHVRGILQHPTPLGRGRADQLQHVAVAFVGGAHVLRLEVLRVARDRRVRVEGVIEERLEEQVPALLGTVRLEQVDGLETRIGLVDPLDRLHGRLEGGFLLPRRARGTRSRRGREPVLERLVRRILAQQEVQRRRARARQTQDEDRAADLVAQHGRIALPRRLARESRRQYAADLAEHHLAARLGEMRLLVVGAQQRAEVIAPARPRRTRRARSPCARRRGSLLRTRRNSVVSPPQLRAAPGCGPPGLRPPYRGPGTLLVDIET